MEMEHLQYTNHQVTNIDSSRTGADTLTLQYDANGNLTRQRDNVKDLTKRIDGWKQCDSWKLLV
ncbi:hypothetical protein LEP1GSC168_0879 [Leptospira santarosai str. HAI134]|nr:hypothetical protein LEP1GSC168_0879 [Leptospira santarosai str. HAI134]